jgi:prepilin-type N-terminal cleavage/methylation domain-containing protein
MQRCRRVGNGGFSLVELIIVIAIMAALIAILAPQLIRYVESSRQTADLSNFDRMNTVFRAAVTDPGNLVRDNMLLTWIPNSGAITVTSADNNAMADIIQNTVWQDVDRNVPGRSTASMTATLTIAYNPSSAVGSNVFVVRCTGGLSDGKLKQGLNERFSANIGAGPGGISS